MAGTSNTNKRSATRNPLSEAATAADVPPFSLSASPHFDAWLAGQGVSLAFSSRHASKLFIVGRGEDGKSALAERTIDACGSLAAAGRSLYAASSWQIWRFENVLGPNESADGYDGIFAPKASHVTGAVDCRDMALDADKRLLFVNGRFSCLAYLSRDFSFHPVWRPSFVSAYAAEDRCRLGGLAMYEGHAAYVTAAGATDTPGGWIEGLTEGGIVIDVKSKEIVCGGLCMPAAPRVVGQTLWLIESGGGFLTRVDIRAGTAERIARLPGYPTAMTIVGNFAVIGLSRSVDGVEADALPLTKALKDAGGIARSGIAVVELTSGNVLHWVAMEGLVDDVYGIAAIGGLVRPRAIGFKSDEIARTISLPPDLE